MVEDVVNPCPTCGAFTVRHCTNAQCSWRMCRRCFSFGTIKRWLATINKDAT